MSKRIAILIGALACILLQATPLFALDTLQRQSALPGYTPSGRQFIQETAEDVREALSNFPERVPAGPEIATLRGRQITISSMPMDKRRNTQIYNDIAELQIQINRTIQVMLARQKRPVLQNKLEVELKELLDLLTIAGIRYNQVANFKLFQDKVRELRQDLRDSYNAYEIANPNNYYMTIRFQLETLMAEVENLLKTFLIR